MNVTPAVLLPNPSKVAATPTNPSSASFRTRLPDKLQSTAKDFESILLTQWLQSAETSFATVPGQEENQDSGDDQMKSFGVQQLAKAFSDAGGVGIASAVAKALAHTEPVKAPQRTGTDTVSR